MSTPASDDDMEEPGEVPSRSDITLFGRAARNWPIDDAKRGEIVDALMGVVRAPGIAGASGPDGDRSPIVDNRTRVSAARVLLDIDRLKMEQERRDLCIPEYHEHRHRGSIDLAMLTPGELADLERIADRMAEARPGGAAGGGPG
jgi:hypothetical protein